VLEEMLQAEENRLANAAAEIKPSIERIIGLLKEEICAPGAANQTTY
jgi:hypothetical protein